MPAARAGQRTTQPAALPAAGGAGTGGTEMGFSVPIGALALLFVIASVAVAALLGFGLAAWLEPVSPWMVGLASAVGVLCTALPLGVAV
ncbi:MAG: hypothetical protein KIT17_22380, partial [Rubrivivax sp.]|nr:hypothetical protein [Rubrivivax sp.]